MKKHAARRRARGSVSAAEFKARCLELMDRVHETREEYVITKRGKPVAKLVPVEARRKKSAFGSMRGSVLWYGDIISPTGVQWGDDADA